jgi:primosomal protein N' (replication factor Y)
VDFAIKDVIDVLDDIPVCTPDLLDLTKWIAEYYVCSWGEALKSALPAGVTVGWRPEIRDRGGRDCEDRKEGDGHRAAHTPG